MSGRRLRALLGALLFAASAALAEDRTTCATLAVTAEKDHEREAAALGAILE